MTALAWLGTACCVAFTLTVDACLDPDSRAAMLRWFKRQPPEPESQIVHGSLADGGIDEQAAADEWWRDLEWPGYYSMATLVNASASERLDEYRKHGPFGRHPYPSPKSLGLARDAG